MTSPAPTYDNGLVLIDQPLNHAGVPHVAHLTFCLSNLALGDATAAAVNFQASFNDNFATLIDSNVTIEKPTAILGDGSDVPTIGVATGAAVVGGNAIDGPPPQVCALFKKITLLGGRANRGRTFFPYLLPDDDIHEDGSISGGTILADLQAAADGFLADLTTNEYPMSICNREVMANPTPPPATYVSDYHLGALVTQYNLENVVATQRRRLKRS